MTNLAKRKRQVIQLQEQKIDNPECTVLAPVYPVEKKKIATWTTTKESNFGIQTALFKANCYQINLKLFLIKFGEFLASAHVVRLIFNQITVN